MTLMQWADLFVFVVAAGVTAWLIWFRDPMKVEMKIKRIDGAMQARHLLMTLEHAKSLDVDMAVYAGTAQGPRAIVGLTFARLGAGRVLLLDCKEDA